MQHDKLSAFFLREKKIGQLMKKVFLFLIYQLYSRTKNINVAHWDQANSTLALPDIPK